MNIQEIYKLYQAHPCITTDSRDCPEGSIFLALKGASFDGNKFAVNALEKGCSYAIIDNATIKEETVQSEYADHLILVEDCLQTYKDLAREHRRQFQIPVIAITGTNGKTTTKELLAAVLSERYNVLFTQGNYNNDVGVPKTLFGLKPEHDIAVVEMGASHPGDIKTLVETTEPTHGLITNIGRAHLLGFGSFEGVKRTKGELYDYLIAHGCPIFLNADNNDLKQMAEERHAQQMFEYSQHSDTDIRGEVISCAPFLRFQWRNGNQPWNEVQTNLIGSYNIDNMLAAIATGIHFGIEEKQICHALESYIPKNNRSQMEVTKHNKLIIDAYNANPTSMAAALDNFKIMDVSPKMVILGKMGELGDIWKEEHQKIVDYLHSAQFDKVWLIGEEYAATDCPYRIFKDVEEVKTALSKERPEGYYILIKGSNSNKLFQLPEFL